jgi:hypothetical protein
MVEFCFHTLLVNLQSLSLTRLISKLEPPFLVGLGPRDAAPQQLAAASPIMHRYGVFGKHESCQKTAS